MLSDRNKRILGLSLPIIGGMVSQNILNLVDTAMVGSLGNAALAAVGLSSFMAFMCQALVMGVSVGVQAMAARRKGEGNEDQSALPLNTGLTVVWTGGILLSGLVLWILPWMYPFFNSDPDVIVQGQLYLQARVMAIVFVGSNFAFRGFWNAIDLPRIYMMTLMVMHAVNILLNYTLIYGNFGFPELGVQGAGIGTALSTAFGTCLYVGLGWKYSRPRGFLSRFPTWLEVKNLVKLSFPNSIQQLFFAGGFTAMYWIIGKIGTAELAAANVIINILLVGILPGIAFGIAATTLVGQALGKNDPSDAARWAWDVGKVCAIVVAILSVPLWSMTDTLLGVFIHDLATLEVARAPLRITGYYLPIDCVGLVLMHSLLGAGDTSSVMKVSIGLQWVVFLPLAYWIGPVMGFGLLGVWYLNAVYRGAQAWIFAWLWVRGQWKGIKV